MAIKFQYNKTSRQQLEKQLGVRERGASYVAEQGEPHYAWRSGKPKKK